MTEEDGAPDGVPPTATETPQIDILAAPSGVQLQFPGLLPVQQIHQVQVWQGQFPPPDAIERYEAVLPGTFDRLIKMAERQQEASIVQTGQAMTCQAQDVRRGHYLGASITLAAVVASVFAAKDGYVTVALALVGVPVLTVAKALIDSVTVSRHVTAQANLVSRPESASDDQSRLGPGNGAAGED